MKVLNSNYSSSLQAHFQSRTSANSPAQKILAFSKALSSPPSNTIFIDSSPDDPETKTLLQKIVLGVTALLAGFLALSLFGSHLEKKLLKDKFNDLKTKSPDFLQTLRSKVDETITGTPLQSKFDHSLLFLLPLRNKTSGELILVVAAKNARFPFFFPQEENGKLKVLGLDLEGKQIELLVNVGETNNPSIQYGENSSTFTDWERLNVTLEVRNNELSKSIVQLRTGFTNFIKYILGGLNLESMSGSKIELAEKVVRNLPSKLKAGSS